MVKFAGKAIRLAPEVDRIYDVTALQGGGFAVAGLQPLGNFDAEKRVWWFDADGKRLGASEILEDFGTRYDSDPELASVDGSTVFSAREVRPDPFAGVYPTLLREMEPGASSNGERAVFDGDTRSTFNTPMLETWGDGFVVGQARDGDAFLDYGIDLQRLDADGATLFQSVVESEEIIRSYDLTEQDDGGLAIAAGFFTSASRYSLRLVTLDAAGEVESSFDLRSLGAETSLAADHVEPIVVELANGDLLVAWFDGFWFAQKFDSNGMPLGGEILLADKGVPVHMDIHALDSGGFLAAWQESGIFPNSIFLREFDALGNPEGRARKVMDTVDNLADPTLLDVGGGDMRLLWYDGVRDDDERIEDFTSQIVLRPIEAQWVPGKVEDGGAGRDRMVGTARDDILSGGAGRDVLKGRKGQDDLRGEGGKDKLLGNGGADVLEGGGGNDNLIGANGDDVLVGGAGNDRLAGGKGADTFIFRDANGIDRIRDFDENEDVILLEGALLGNRTADNPVDDFEVVESGGDTILRWDNDAIDAQIILEGVINLDYDTNLLFGPIFAY